MLRISYMKMERGDSHLVDTVGPFESPLLDLRYFIPTHVQDRQVGDPVEKSEGADLCDLVIRQDEVSCCGGDARRDVLNR